jgi:hypothetical protein
MAVPTGSPFRTKLLRLVQHSLNTVLLLVLRQPYLSEIRHKYVHTLARQLSFCAHGQVVSVAAVVTGYWGAHYAGARRCESNGADGQTVTSTDPPRQCWIQLTDLFDSCTGL